MNCLGQENNKKVEDNMIKDVRSLFRLKGEINYTAIKGVRNIFD